MRATRAIVHLDSLRRNIRIVRNEVGPDVKICMAVKADAYGHGAVAAARTAVEAGVDYLGVATIDEGRELRDAGVAQPVLLFSPCLPEEYPHVADCDLSPMLGSLVEIERLERAAARRSVKVHLKIDTGMGRIGCPPEDAASLAGRIAESPRLILEGVCTHFPVADVPDDGFTRRQLAAFETCLADIRSRGIEPALVHAANSGAIIGHPESTLNMVRPGIMLYGYYPSHEQERRLRLEPVMELRTQVVFLKRVARGTRLSYGLTYTVPRNTVIATLPVGYADGYSRLLSNKAEVLIGKRRYPVVGRICMDQCLVDLGPEAPVRLYDEAVLFGPDPDGPDAEEIAGLMNTIPYEVTCLVSKRVPRIYSGDRGR